MARRLMAEAVGTLFLLMTIVGSGVMGDNLAAAQPGDTLLPHAVVIGAMLFVLITLLGPVSGAHFNPAVTMVFAVRRDLPPSEAMAYAAVQIAAGICGVLLVHLMFGLDVVQTSVKVRTGAGQWVAEIIATSGLVWVILAGLRTAPHLIPVMVGAYIMAALWFTASTSFANPAVTIARMLSDTFSGIRPADAPLFIVAQIAGAFAGMALAGLTHPRDEPPGA